MMSHHSAAFSGVRDPCRFLRPRRAHPPTPAERLRSAQSCRLGYVIFRRWPDAIASYGVSYGFSFLPRAAQLLEGSNDQQRGSASVPIGGAPELLSETLVRAPDGAGGTMAPSEGVGALADEDTEGGGIERR